MIELNETTFNEVIGGDKRVVVDFWASWCGPCRATAPTFKKWSEDHAEKAIFGKINVDDEQSLATAYRISAIPAVLVFENGKEVKRWQGFPTEKDLLESIK